MINGVLWTCSWCGCDQLGLGLYEQFMGLHHIQDDELLKPTKFFIFYKRNVL